MVDHLLPYSPFTNHFLILSLKSNLSVGQLFMMLRIAKSSFFFGLV